MKYLRHHPVLTGLLCTVCVLWISGCRGGGDSRAAAALRLAVYPGAGQTEAQALASAETWVASRLPDSDPSIELVAVDNPAHAAAQLASGQADLAWLGAHALEVDGGRPLSIQDHADASHAWVLVPSGPPENATLMLQWKGDRSGALDFLWAALREAGIPVWKAPRAIRLVDRAGLGDELSGGGPVLALMPESAWRAMAPATRSVAVRQIEARPAPGLLMAAAHVPARTCDALKHLLSQSGHAWEHPPPTFGGFAGTGPRERLPESDWRRHLHGFAAWSSDQSCGLEERVIP